MTNAKISVVMASYNHAPFVAQAIDSVLTQREVDLEFLITDDGSSDSTRDEIRKIHDSRIRFLPNELNRGACVVTNELLDLATGEFVALINSDDYWSTPDKLAYQLDILQSSPAVGATFGRANFVDRSGTTIEKATLGFGGIFDQPDRTRGRWLRRFFDLGNCICHPTMLIRRRCYEEVGKYNNRLRQLPDLDMWIRLTKHYELHISDRELLNFRVMPGENASSQTTDNWIRTINEHYLIAETFFDGIDKATLIDGFGDVLRMPDLPTNTHVEIEKVLLYFAENEWLWKPYRMVGLLHMHRLMNDQQSRDMLESDYGINDRWFQKMMVDVDVIRPRSAAIASTVNHQVKGKLRRLRALFRGPG